MNPATRPTVRLVAWWVIWATTIVVLVILHFAVGRWPSRVGTGREALVQLAGVVPLFVSIIIRWLVLPRLDSLKAAFPMFIIGVALAEACGLLGIFLGGPYRDYLVILGVLAIGQFMPLFARQLAEPRPRGYIPNN